MDHAADFSMTRTGYEVTYEDFMRLVSDPYCVPEIAPLLKRWFNYDIVPIGPPAKKGYASETIIRDAEGHEVGKARLHLIIQADPDLQNTLYNTSQSLWR